MTTLHHELIKLRNLASHVDKKVRKYGIDASEMKQAIDAYIFRIEINQEIKEAINDKRRN
jgi:23S rRNA maturation-related 3'-5' exoribonuclease YhaM